MFHTKPVTVLFYYYVFDVLAVMWDDKYLGTERYAAAENRWQKCQGAQREFLRWHNNALTMGPPPHRVTYPSPPFERTTVDGGGGAGRGGGDILFTYLERMSFARGARSFIILNNNNIYVLAYIAIIILLDYPLHPCPRRILLLLVFTVIYVAVGRRGDKYW